MEKIAQPLNAQKAENYLLVLLKNGPRDRKQLVAEFLKNVDLSPEERRDTRPGAALNKAKCTIGIAITNLINMGHLKQDDSTVSLAKSIDEVKKDIKRDPLIREIILREIGSSRCTKAELLNKVFEIYKKDYDPNAKVTTIKGDSGRILSGLQRTEEIQLKDGYYSLCALPVAEPTVEKNKIETEKVTKATDEKPVNTPTEKERAKEPALKVTPKKTAVKESAAKKTTPNERNRILFSRLSDEEFVNRSVEMLECWYRKRFSTLTVKGENIDGSEDGGIDGKIVVSDMLWGGETVVLQMKHVNSPKKKTIPLREIQEFCGVLSAEKNAGKGIFLTNVKYTTRTVQFVQKYTHKPIVLVDGQKWLELAQSCGYNLPDPE